MSIGKEIRVLRMAAGMTREDLARAISSRERSTKQLKQAAGKVGRWENGKAIPFPNTLAKLANALADSQRCPPSRLYEHWKLARAQEIAERYRKENKTTRPIVYPQLMAEISTRGVTRKQIFTALEISQSGLYAKLHGDVEFTLAEAVKIHETFFPETDFLTLFRRAEQE